MKRLAVVIVAAVALSPAAVRAAQDHPFPSISVEQARALATDGAAAMRHIPGVAQNRVPSVRIHTDLIGAARALAAEFGVVLDEAPLNAIDGPARDALARVLETFTVHHAVTRSAPGNIALKLATKDDLLSAVWSLDAIVVPEGADGSACEPIEIVGVALIDLGACDDVHTRDFALLVDAGGNDVYLNNAGGSNPSTPSCPGAPHGAAALIDLGGHDDYGDEASPFSCGINGGGFNGGSGFLFDGGGNDVYTGALRGTNGAGFLGGMGFLLDVEGDDLYQADSTGANGGGNQGIGMLLDGSGDDLYSAGDAGTNGGGWLGSGFLFDAGGTDEYSAGSLGANGGVVNGVGRLIDGGGDDGYYAGSAANGGSSGDPARAGSALLLDLAGKDLYSDYLGLHYDCSVVPNGIGGASIDFPSPRC